MLTSTGPPLWDELLQADALVASLATLGALLGEMRRRFPPLAVVAIGSDAAAMETGVDASCPPDVAPDVLAAIARRAISDRRSRARWPRSFGDKRLLLLAPEPGVAHAWSAALSRIGNVSAAQSAADALRLLREDEVHVVVVDARAGAYDSAALGAAIAAFDPTIGLVIADGDAASADIATSVERAWVAWGMARADLGAPATPLWNDPAAQRFATIAQRLHEVDARRVELLKKLADAHLELDRLATIDPITEMLNRRGLDAALAREIEIARRTGGSVAACFVDCDDFNRINERFGHNTGDVVLRRIAERLKDALRVSDTIGRVGGDEFLMLFPQTRIAEAMMVAERARVAVSEAPLAIDDGRVDVAVSIGVVVLPWDTTSLEEVLPAARLALRESKQSGKNQVSGADGEQPLAHAIEELIRELVSGDGLRAVAQPIVRVSDERVIGYEMLSRGREGLFEAPDQFLRIARDRGVLTTVDMQCLKICLEEAQKIPLDVSVHVNLFPSTLLDISTAQLVSLLRIEGGEPLCLELSEEQFIGDPRELLDRISALRASGVRLAIDDVGKGRGTLDSVMLLEPEIVKIDKELISDAYKDVRKERLLRRLVTLATTLHCDVVGEGVEEAGDLELLRELDVPYAQGFYWSKPRPYADLT